VVRFLRSKIVVGVIWLLIAMAIPFVWDVSTLQQGQLSYIVSVLMVSIGLNLVLGYAGQLFLGPGAMFAGGAYAAAYMAVNHTEFQSLWAMSVVAVIASVVLAAIAALPTLRVSGFYLGLVTLFMAQAIPLVASHVDALGGVNGLSLVVDPNFVQHPEGRALYEVGLLIVGAMALYTYLIVYSRLGRRFTTLRAGDDLAQAVAIPTYTTKLTAFLLAAVPCGLGGAFYVYSQQFVAPGSVDPTLSIYILAGMVIGGGGTILGPLIGTALVFGALQFLPNVNENISKYEGIVFGALLIVVASGLPYGLMGLTYGARAVWAKWRGKPFRLFSPMPAAAPAGADVGELAGERLIVTDVRRSFGGVKALGGVSLTVEPGTVHALVGPNGSGKTTLLNAICGFYRPHGGQIWLGDKRLDGHRVSEITAMGVGRTFQTPKLSTYDTVLANVLVGADRPTKGWLPGGVVRTRRARRNDKIAVRRALDALARVGIEDDAYTMATELSHGTQRLIEIARAVALEPTLLLLDEPAAGLSVAEAEVLTKALRSLAQSGLSVLLVEHNLPVVFDVADEVTVLDEGLVLAAGRPAEVSVNPEVVRVYLGTRRPAAKAAEALMAEAIDER
jgi:ABC-type branched-subunit amino acid transport system ATPase component/ABC-type branched-subunit amino acid transport system permease subunit